MEDEPQGRRPLRRTFPPGDSDRLIRCPACSTEIAPSLAACPVCGRLAHWEEIQTLTEKAERATREGRPSDALAAWRRALELFPPGSRQYEIVSRRAEELSRSVDASPAPSKAPAWVASLGVFGLLLWKFKFLIVIVATKAKFLLFGLSKAGTLSSMLLSLGVYWTAWGWKFALGVVLSIYVHEMGHVAALRRFGIAATAPMFVPGLGAFIRLKAAHLSPVEDARVGLAGPNWGLACALFCAGVYALTKEPYWAAIAGVGAWINLFNLTPILGLDGDRALRPLSRTQRVLAMLVVGATCFAFDEGILLLVLLVGIFRCGAGEKEEGDWTAFGNYAALVVVLTALSRIRSGF